MIIMTNTDIVYNVPTTNRFAQLPIPIPDNPTLRIPRPAKSITPPAFFVLHTTVSNVRELVPNSNNYVIQNLDKCVGIFPNTITDHTRLFAHLKTIDLKFHTHPTDTPDTKRFVLHDLNTHPVEDIKKDLQNYGLNPTLITSIPIKHPRFDDQATYIVHFDKALNVTIDIVKQAKYICSTVARWTHYIPNGDGVIICSRCTIPGHTSRCCNRDPKCKVCSQAHLTKDCPLILAKRQQGKTEIDKQHLKCPSCDQQHTAGYRFCIGRTGYLKNRTKRQQKLSYVNAPAPAPERNPWKLATTALALNPSHHPVRPPPVTQSPNLQFSNTHQNQRPPPQITPVYNNNHYNNNTQNPYSSNQNNRSDKFNTNEIFDIFYKIIDVVENCNTKADQLRAMGQIISQHLI